MRGNVKPLLFASLILLPIIVTAAVTTAAIRFFQDDKELYVFDLSAQSVQLVARNLEANLDSIRLKAELRPEGSGLLAVERPPPGKVPERGFAIANISRQGRPRLRLYTRGKAGPLAVDIKPEALLDLRGYEGPTRLMVVNASGQILLHTDPELVARRMNQRTLLQQARVFSDDAARVGTREVGQEEPVLVAYARVGPQLAVLQTIGKRAVLAAATPLVTNAAIAAAVAVGLAIIVALLLGRVLGRPLQQMARQAEAIGRGEFDVAMVSGGTSGEMAALMHSFNEMSAALKKREQELSVVQRQLLHSERLNTAGRVVTAIVKELSTPLETCFSLASQTGHSLPEKSNLRPLQKKIMDEANKASNILQNLSRLTAREEMSGGSAEPDMVVQDVLISSKPLLQKRQLRVETDLDPQVGMVRIAMEDLRNVLLDIVLFVTGEATAGSAIQIAVKPAGGPPGRPLLSVAYSGAPLSQQQRDSLLKPAQASETDKGSFELAVAAMVLDEQGGKLSFEGEGGSHRILASLPTD